MNQTEDLLELNSFFLKENQWSVYCYFIEIWHRLVKVSKKPKVPQHYLVLVFPLFYYFMCINLSNLFLFLYIFIYFT